MVLKSFKLILILVAACAVTGVTGLGSHNSCSCINGRLAGQDRSICDCQCSPGWAGTCCDRNVIEQNAVIGVQQVSGSSTVQLHTKLLRHADSTYTYKHLEGIPTPGVVYNNVNLDYTLTTIYLMLVRIIKGYPPYEMIGTNTYIHHSNIQGWMYLHRARIRTKKSHLTVGHQHLVLYVMIIRYTGACIINTSTIARFTHTKKQFVTIMRMLVRPEMRDKISVDRHYLVGVFLFVHSPKIVWFLYTKMISRVLFRFKYNRVARFHYHKTAIAVKFWTEFLLRCETRYITSPTNPITESEYETEVQFVTFTIDHASPNTIALMKDESQRYWNINAWVAIMKTNAKGRISYDLKYITRFHSSSNMILGLQHQNSWLVSALVKINNVLPYYLLFLQEVIYPETSTLVTPGHDTIRHQKLFSSTVRTWMGVEGVKYNYLLTIASVILHCAQTRFLYQSHRDFERLGRRLECGTVVASGYIYGNLLVRQGTAVEVIFHRRYTHLQMKRIVYMQTNVYLKLDRITEISTGMFGVENGPRVTLSGHNRPVTSSVYPNAHIWKYYDAPISTTTIKQEHLITLQWIGTLVDMTIIPDKEKFTLMLDHKSLLIIIKNNNQETVGMLEPVELIYPEPASDFESRHILHRTHTKVSVKYQSFDIGLQVERLPIVAYVSIMQYCSDEARTVEDSQFMYQFHKYDCTAAVSNLSLRMFRSIPWLENKVLRPIRFTNRIEMKVRYSETLILLEVSKTPYIDRLVSEVEIGPEISYHTGTVSFENHITRSKTWIPYILETGVYFFKAKQSKPTAGTGGLIKYKLLRTSHTIVGKAPTRIKLTISTLTAICLTTGLLEPIEQFPWIDSISLTTRRHAFRPFAYLTPHFGSREVGEQEVVWNVKDLFSDKMRHCAHGNTISITDNVDLEKYFRYECANILMTHPIHDDELFVTNFRVAQLDQQIFLRSQIKKNLQMLTWSYLTWHEYKLRITAIEIEMSHWFKTFGTKTQFVTLTPHTNEALITVFKRSIGVDSEKSTSKRRKYEDKRRRKTNSGQQPPLIRALEAGTDDPIRERPLTEAELMRYSGIVSEAQKEIVELKKGDLPRKIEDKDAGSNGEHRKLDTMKDNDKISDEDKVKNEDLLQFKKREDTLIILKKREEEILNLKKRDNSATLKTKKTMTSYLIKPIVAYPPSWAHETDRTTTTQSATLEQKLYPHMKTYFGIHNLGSASCTYINYIEILHIRGCLPRPDPAHHLATFSGLKKYMQDFEVLDSSTWGSLKEKGGLVIVRHECYPRNSCQMDRIIMVLNSYDLKHFSWLVAKKRPASKQYIVIQQVYSSSSSIIDCRVMPYIQITSDTVTTIEFIIRLTYKSTHTMVELKERLIRPVVRRHATAIISRSISTNLKRLFFHYQEIIITRQHSSHSGFTIPKFATSSLYQIHVIARGSIVECKIRPVLKSQVMVIVNDYDIKQMHGKFSGMEFIHVHDRKYLTGSPDTAHDIKVFKQFCWKPVSNIARFVSRDKLREEVVRTGFRNVDSVILDGIEQFYNDRISVHCMPIFIISYGEITFKMSYNSIHAKRINPVSMKLFVIYKTLYTAAGSKVIHLKPNLTFTAATSEEQHSSRLFRTLSYRMIFGNISHRLRRSTAGRISSILIPNARIAEFGSHALTLHKMIGIEFSKIEEILPESRTTSSGKSVALQMTSGMLEVHKISRLVFNSDFEERHTMKQHSRGISRDLRAHIFKKTLIGSIKPLMNFALSHEDCNQVNQGRSFEPDNGNCVEDAKAAYESRSSLDSDDGDPDFSRESGSSKRLNYSKFKGRKWSSKKICKARAAQEILEIDSKGKITMTKCKYYAIGDSTEIARIGSFINAHILGRKVKVLSLIKSLSKLATKTGIVQKARESISTHVIISPTHRAIMFHSKLTIKPVVRSVRWRQGHAKTLASIKNFVHVMKSATSSISNTPTFLLRKDYALGIKPHPSFKRVSTHVVQYQSSKRHKQIVIPHKIRVLAHTITKPHHFKYSACKISETTSFIHPDRGVIFQQDDVALMVFKQSPIRIAMGGKKTKSMPRISTGSRYKNDALRIKYKSTAQAVEFYYGFGTFDCNQCTSRDSDGGSAVDSGDCKESHEDSATTVSKGKGDSGRKRGNGKANRSNGKSGSTKSGSRKCTKRRSPCQNLRCASKGGRGCQVSINHMYTNSGLHYSKLKISKASRLNALRCMICTTCTTFDGSQGKKKVDLSTVKVVNFCPSEEKKQRFRKRSFNPYHYCIHGLDGPYYWIMPFTNYFIIWGFGLNTHIFDFSIFYSFYNHHYYRYSYTNYYNRDYKLFMNSRTKRYYPQPNREIYTQLTNNLNFPVTFCLCSFYYSMNIRLLQPDTITRTFETVTSTTYRTFFSVSNIMIDRYNMYIWNIPFDYDVTFKSFGNPIPQINTWPQMINKYKFINYGIDSAKPSFTLKFGVILKIILTESTMKLSPGSLPSLKLVSSDQPQHTLTMSFKNVPSEYRFVQNVIFRDVHPRQLIQLYQIGRLSERTIKTVFSTVRFVTRGRGEVVFSKTVVSRNIIIIYRPRKSTRQNVTPRRYIVLTTTTQTVSRHRRKMISSKTLRKLYKNYEKIMGIIQRTDVDEKYLYQKFEVPVLNMKISPLLRFDYKNDHKIAMAPSWNILGFTYVYKTHLITKEIIRADVITTTTQTVAVTILPKSKLIVVQKSTDEEHYLRFKSRIWKRLWKTTVLKSKRISVIYPYNLFTHRMTVREGWIVSEKQIGINRDSVAVEKWNSKTDEKLIVVKVIQFITTTKSVDRHTFKQNTKRKIARSDSHDIITGRKEGKTDLTFTRQVGRRIAFKFTQKPQAIFEFISYKITKWSTPTVKKGKVVRSDTYEETEFIIEKQFWATVATVFETEEKHTFTKSGSRRPVTIPSGKEMIFEEYTKTVKIRYIKNRIILFQKLVLYLLRVRTITQKKDDTVGVLTVKTSALVLKELNKDHKVTMKVWQQVKTLHKIKEGHSKKFFSSIDTIKQEYDQYKEWRDVSMNDLDFTMQAKIMENIKERVGYVKRVVVNESMKTGYKRYKSFGIVARLIHKFLKTEFIVFEVLTIQTTKSFKTEDQHTFQMASSRAKNHYVRVRDRTMERSIDDTGVKYHKNIIVKFIKTHNALRRFFLIEFVSRKYHKSSRFITDFRRILKYVETKSKKVKRWYVKLHHSHRTENRHIFKHLMWHTLQVTRDEHFQGQHLEHEQQSGTVAKYGSYVESRKMVRFSKQFLCVEFTFNRYRRYKQFVFAVQRLHNYLSTEEKHSRKMFVIITYSRKTVKHKLDLFCWHKTSKWDDYYYRKRVLVEMDKTGVAATLTKANIQKNYAYYGHRLDIRTSYLLSGANAYRFIRSATVQTGVDRINIKIIVRHHKTLQSSLKVTRAKHLKLFHVHVRTDTLTNYTTRAQLNNILLISFQAHKFVREGAAKKISHVAMFRYITSSMAQLHKTKTIWFAVTRQISYLKSEGEVKEWIVYKVVTSFEVNDGPKIIQFCDMASNHKTVLYGRIQTDIVVDRSSLYLKSVRSSVNTFTRITSRIITFGSIDVTRHNARGHELVAVSKVWYQQQNYKILKKYAVTFVLRKKIINFHTIMLSCDHSVRTLYSHRMYRNRYKRRRLLHFIVTATTRALVVKSGKATNKFIFIEKTDTTTKLTSKYLFGVVRDISYVRGEFEPSAEKWVKVVRLSHETSQHKCVYLQNHGIANAYDVRNDKLHETAVMDRKGIVGKTTMQRISHLIVSHKRVIRYNMMISHSTTYVVKYVSSKVNGEGVLTMSKTIIYKPKIFATNHALSGHTIKCYQSRDMRIFKHSHFKRYRYTELAETTTKGVYGERMVLASKQKMSLAITYTTESLCGVRKVRKYYFTVTRAGQLQTGEGEVKASRAPRLGVSAKITQFKKMRMFKEDTSAVIKHRSSKMSIVALVEIRPKLNQVNRYVINVNSAKMLYFWVFKPRIVGTKHITKKITTYVVKQIEYQKQNMKITKVYTIRFKQVVKIIQEHLISCKHSKTLQVIRKKSKVIFQNMRVKVGRSGQLRRVASQTVSDVKIEGSKILSSELTTFVGHRNSGRFAYTIIRSIQYVGGESELNEVVQAVMTYLQHDILTHKMKESGCVNVNVMKKGLVTVSSDMKIVYRKTNYKSRSHPSVKAGTRALIKESALTEGSIDKAKVKKFTISSIYQHRYEVVSFKMIQKMSIKLDVKIIITGKNLSTGVPYKIICKHKGVSNTYNHFVESRVDRTVFHTWQYFRVRKSAIITSSMKPSGIPYPDLSTVSSARNTIGQPSAVRIENHYDQVTEMMIRNKGGPTKLFLTIGSKCGHAVYIFGRMRATSNVVYVGKTNDKNKKKTVTISMAKYKYTLLVKQEVLSPGSGGSGGSGVGFAFDLNTAVAPRKARTYKQILTSSFMEYVVLQCRWYREKLELKQLVQSIEKSKTKRSEKKKKKELAKNRIRAFREKYGYDYTFNEGLYYVSGFGVVLNKSWKKKCPSMRMKLKASGKGKKGSGRGAGGKGGIKADGYYLKSGSAKFMYQAVQTILINTKAFVATCRSPTYITESKTNIYFKSSLIPNTIMASVSVKQGGFTFITRHQDNSISMYVFDGMVSDEDKITSASMVRKWPDKYNFSLQREERSFVTKIREKGRPHYMMLIKGSMEPKKKKEKTSKKGTTKKKS